MFTPPRCRVCYDKLNIFSDITLGDPWEMTGVDWDCGDNLILTRTKIGVNLLESAVKAGVVSVHAADKKEMLHGQGVNQRREQVHRYTQAYREMPFAMTDAPIVCTEENSIGPTEKELNTLQTFVGLDVMNKDKLYTIATEIISSYEKKQHLQWRIWRKLKRILKKL